MVTYDKTWTVAELRRECKRQGLSGYSRLNKAKLITLLLKSQSKPEPQTGAPPPSGGNKCEGKVCKATHICNPTSGRCVDRKGKIGQKLAGEGAKPEPQTGAPPSRGNKCEGKVCKVTHICNPASGRCVDRKGKIGQKLAGEAGPKPKPPPGPPPPGQPEAKSMVAEITKLLKVYTILREKLFDLNIDDFVDAEPPRAALLTMSMVREIADSYTAIHVVAPQEHAHVERLTRDSDMFSDRSGDDHDHIGYFHGEPDGLAHLWGSDLWWVANDALGKWISKQIVRSKKRLQEEKSKPKPKPKPKSGYECGTEYIPDQNLTLRTCKETTKGKFNSLDACLYSGCEDGSSPPAPGVSANVKVNECFQKYCKDYDDWRVCYKKEFLKYHPDKLTNKGIDPIFAQEMQHALSACNDFYKETR